MNMKSSGANEAYKYRINAPRKGGNYGHEKRIYTICDMQPHSLSFPFKKRGTN